MKHIFSLVLFLSILCASASAQEENKAEFKNGFMNHLDLSLTAGTTGLGFDIAAPIGDYVQVRAGYSIMPRFKYDMDFGIQVGDDPKTSQSKFEKLSGLLTQITGNSVDNHVTMEGRPTYYNFSLLVDVYPFKNNKHWHFTGGFYLGPSKVADALNSIKDMQSLLAVNIYNNIYNKVSKGEPIIVMNENDVYLDPAYEEKILSYGRMGIHIGDYKNQFLTDEAGNPKLDANGNPIHKPYMMEPDNEGTVNAEATANAFKPYLGFGYGGRLFKKNDKYKVSFDCGAMFWGGTPDIVTHDGVNLTKDLINIRGDVNDYVHLIKGVKVFPVLNLRISRTLF